MQCPEDDDGEVHPEVVDDKNLRAALVRCCFKTAHFAKARTQTPMNLVIVMPDITEDPMDDSAYSTLSSLVPSREANA
jgi:hypothetical protein